MSRPLTTREVISACVDLGTAVGDERVITAVRTVLHQVVLPASGMDLTTAHQLSYLDWSRWGLRDDSDAPEMANHLRLNIMNGLLRLVEDHLGTDDLTAAIDHELVRSRMRLLANLVVPVEHVHAIITGR